MTNKQANSIGATTMLLIAIIIIYTITCSSCNIIKRSFNIIKPNHNLYPISDDTEHIWIGSNKDTIIE